MLHSLDKQVWIISSVDQRGASKKLKGMQYPVCMSSRVIIQSLYKEKEATTFEFIFMSNDYDGGKGQ